MFFVSLKMYEQLEGRLDVLLIGRICNMIVKSPRKRNIGNNRFLRTTIFFVKKTGISEREEITIVQIKLVSEVNLVNSKASSGVVSNKAAIAPVPGGSK